MNYPDEFEITSPFCGLKSFLIPYKNDILRVIASYEPNGWAHLSVSLQDRDPTWEEMCFIKDIFFEEEDICLQFHPRKSEYVNISKHCLHLWKPTESVIDAIGICQ